MDQQLGRNRVVMVLALILGFSLFMRLAVGIACVNTYDVYWYRTWAVDLPNGLFTVYDRAADISLDYPPVYLFFLYPIGKIYEIIGTDAHVYIQMLLMKFWPIVFDVLCSLVLYLICVRYSPLSGLFAAGAWAMNPSLLFNTSVWGQTDQLMALLLLLAFWFLEEERPVLCCVAFAVAGLTKYQSLFFTPVFLLELYTRTNLKSVLKGIGAAAATVIAVFLPFMVGARNPLLFFDVYFGGAGKYPYCTLNAYNLYGIFGLNWTHRIEDNAPLFGGFTYAMLSNLMLAASLVLLIYLYLKGRRTCGWVGGLLFMQCLFMFMTRMHERYQVVVLPFALMAYVKHRRPGFFGIFAALSGITLINQFIVLLPIMQNGSAPWMDYRDEIMTVFSTVNLAVCLWTIYLCIDFFLAAVPEKPDGALSEGGASPGDDFPPGEKAAPPVPDRGA